MDQELYDAGLAKRRKVVGREYVDRALGGADSFTRPFQELITTYCWGGVWGSGTALDDHQRSLNNLCILASMGRWEELELHLHGALRNGCTPDEIRETLTQIAVYAGVPVGVSAFKIARRVLEEEGIEIPA